MKLAKVSVRVSLTKKQVNATTPFCTDSAIEKFRNGEFKLVVNSDQYRRLLNLTFWIKNYACKLKVSGDPLG